jgi:4-amino-4-deoxy-L-arabinose transferase-like glycosyltransferase
MTPGLPLRASSLARDRLLAFALFALVLGAGIGLRDPWPADEPRFALVAKTMVETGDYWFPRRGSELYPDKPPLFMWLQAAAYHVVGSWRVAFLLPSLLSGLLVLALVYDLARRHASRRAALIATGFVALTFQFTFQMKGAQIDPVLVGFVTLGAYGLLRHLLHGPAWGWWTLGWAAAGLGVIAKAVGFLALFVLVPYVVMRWRAPARLPAIPWRDWRWLAGPAAFAAVISLWLVPMLLRVHASGDPALEAYARNILFSQTVERYLDPWHHVKPPWYFVEVILTAWQPIAIVLIAALPALAARWRRGRVDPRVVLPFGMFVLTLLFFSASAGKRDMYILPALPMLAVALAPLLPGLLRRVWVQRALWTVATLLAAALAAMAVLAWTGEPRFEETLAEARGIDPWPFAFGVGALGLLIAALCRPRRGALAFAAFASSLWIAWGFIGYPMLDESRSARGVMQAAGRAVGPDAELALVGWSEQHYLQADRPVAEFGFRRPKRAQLRDAIGWLDAAPARRFVFARDDELAPCIDLSKAIPVGRANRRSFVVFQADAVTEACRRDGPGEGEAPPAPDGRIDRSRTRAPR